MRERTTLLVSLTVLGGLAAGSYWLAERAHQADSTRAPLRHEPDYIVERFEMTRMDLQGVPQYSMNAQQMTHYADDDSADVIKPSLISRKTDRPVIHVDAERGQISSGAEQVHLYENAQVRRAATPTQAEMVMRSNYFLALPDEDIVRTNQPVQIEQTGSVIDASSMEYDNGYQSLALNSLVNGRGHATIAPRNRPAATTGQTRP